MTDLEIIRLLKLMVASEDRSEQRALLHSLEARGGALRVGVLLYARSLVRLETEHRSEVPQSTHSVLPPLH